MKEVLIVSIGFSPNVGGIETHFDDLTRALDKKGWKVWVLTYKPITTKVGASIYERRGEAIEIYRIPWISNLFYLLVKSPALEFIYLIPGLFFVLPLFLLIKGRNIKTIHSHGLVSGFVSVLWGKIFGKRVITTTHSIYHFPKNGYYRNIAFWIFNNSDKVLTLSRQSKKEIENLGIEESRVVSFRYWIDLNLFKKKNNAKSILKWTRKFVILFVGRLIPEKGIRELLRAAADWNDNIFLAIAGVGPLEEEISRLVKIQKNITYLGSLSQKELPTYYSGSDLLIVPSIHEEGFGRVIIESLACETPVLGANRGAIPEALDKSVGRLITISPESIKKEVDYFYSHPQELKKLSKNARYYALQNFSEKNVNQIINTLDN